MKGEGRVKIFMKIIDKTIVFNVEFSYICIVLEGLIRQGARSWKSRC